MQGVSLCKTCILVSFAHCVHNKAAAAAPLIAVIHTSGTIERTTCCSKSGAAPLRTGVFQFCTEIRNREYHPNVKADKNMIEKFTYTCESLHLSGQMEIAVNTNAAVYATISHKNKLKMGKIKKLVGNNQRRVFLGEIGEQQKTLKTSCLV